MDEPMDTTENVKPRGWPQLPKEMKRFIIKFLSFPDKQNMMLVDWECARICLQLPNKLNELGITELPSTAKTTIIMKWKNPYGRIVSRLVEYRGAEMRQTDCPDYTREALKTFLRVWKISKVKNIIIEIPCFEGLSSLWDEIMSDPLTSIAVKYFNIRTNDYRLVQKALGAAKNSKHEISLLANDHGGMETSVFDSPKVKDARSVILWSLTSNINDGQLIALKANNIRVMSNNITSVGISRMIREWRQGIRSLERLHISAPLVNLDDIVREIDCICWKDMTDICQVIWREVDEEGYSYATRGPTSATPAAFGMVQSEGMSTFIFRIIKMTAAMSQTLTERCGQNCPSVNRRIEQATQ